MDSTSELHIGQRIRHWRKQRGLSQQYVADFAGITRPYLSMIETGRRSVDRRSTLSAIANALRVTMADLTDHWYPQDDPVQSEAQARLASVGIALMDSDLDDGADAAPRPIPALVAEAEFIRSSWIACSYADAAERLPAALAEAHALAASGPHRAEGLRLAADLCMSTFITARSLGRLDLAYPAAERALAAARALGEDQALLAAAEFNAIHARMACGGYRRSYNLAVRAADDLSRSMPSSGPVAEVHGMLHLTAAMCATVTGRPADGDDHLAEAARQADRLGEGAYAGLFFGPTNVGIWRLALEIERGEPDVAIRNAASVRPQAIGSPARASNYWGDLARARYQVKDNEGALRAVFEAERLGPLWVRRDVFMRDLVANVYWERRRRAAGTDLERAAVRFGVTPDGDREN